ncbi:MAG TPA: LemA family protein, partial [Candidatus Marinimicrobia bacterium]|nr:LemA family protein [Candidatus Neomarinimicrobiota bacterium]
MKKGWVILIAVVVVVLLIVGAVINIYNNLVSLEESVNQAWAQVSNQYQRRADLIPNLVETVKGYAAH